LRSAGRLPIECAACCWVGMMSRSGTICKGSREWRWRENQPAVGCVELPSLPQC